MLGMIDLGVFKGFVNKELDDGEIISSLSLSMSSNTHCQPVPLEMNSVADEVFCL